VITIRAFNKLLYVDTETGELKEHGLMHREGAEEIYRALAALTATSMKTVKVDGAT
jgi:hypothetical protein